MSERDHLLDKVKSARAAVGAARVNRLALYRPYPKQADFHAAGLAHRERLFSAGNQLGKTWAGGYEAAMHASGRYPDWWVGRRFNRATSGWVSAVSGTLTRDAPQRILMGRRGQWGTGTIPKDAIAETTLGRGVPDGLDNVRVKHINGGVSHIGFKSYEQGREAWQGESLDWLWLDEEPEEEIYTEALARITATRGMISLTCTPLLGMSEVQSRFYDSGAADRSITTMAIEEAEHIPPEERGRIIAGYAPHEREARTKGIPMLGSGKVFPVTEESILCDAFPIPDHFACIVGMDFGWDHPTAAAWLAWDRDTDTIYVTDAYRAKEQTPVVHAAAIKARGENIPIAWPHDGLQHDKGSGEQLASIYREQGLRMLPERATFEDGGNGLEAGVMEMLNRMQTGRLKVFRHLGDWLDEFRRYHRKDGRIVKKFDDLISATRYGVMMRREGKTWDQCKSYRRGVRITYGAGDGAGFSM